MTWLLTYSGESFVRKCLSLDFPKSLEKIPSPWGFAFKITRICFWFLKNTTGAGPLGASHQAADSFDRDEAFPRKRTVGDVGTWYVFVQKKDLKDVHPWNLTSNHWFSGDMLVFGGVTDVFQVFMYVYLEPFDDPGWDFSQLLCLEFGACFGGGKIPLNDLPDWNMLSLLVLEAGRKFCKWQTDFESVGKNMQLRPCKSTTYDPQKALSAP